MRINKKIITGLLIIVSLGIVFLISLKFYHGSGSSCGGSSDAAIACAPPPTCDDMCRHDCQYDGYSSGKCIIPFIFSVKNINCRCEQPFSCEQACKNRGYWKAYCDKTVDKKLQLPISGDCCCEIIKGEEGYPCNYEDSLGECDAGWVCKAGTDSNGKTTKSCIYLENQPEGAYCWNDDSCAKGLTCATNSENINRCVSSRKGACVLESFDVNDPSLCCAGLEKIRTEKGFVCKILDRPCAVDGEPVYKEKDVNGNPVVGPKQCCDIEATIKAADPAADSNIKGICAYPCAKEGENVFKFDPVKCCSPDDVINYFSPDKASIEKGFGQCVNKNLINCVGEGGVVNIGSGLRCCAGLDEQSFRPDFTGPYFDAYLWKCVKPVVKPMLNVPLN